MNTTQKGFTLIELLVVIAIVAVLSVVVILTLNPAELLRQARDSNRISDLNTVHSALSLYLADVTSPVLAPSYSSCYMARATTSNCGFSTTRTAVQATSGQEASVSGNGWVPVNFASITTQSPISKLPIDPTNDATYYYAYAATSSPVFAYELKAKMESAKYSTGTQDVMVNTKDGGSDNAWFEVGSLLTF